jgi:hypothetical protein
MCFSAANPRPVGGRYCLSWRAGDILTIAKRHLDDAKLTRAISMDRIGKETRIT